MSSKGWDFSSADVGVFANHERSKRFKLLRWFNGLMLEAFSIYQHPCFLRVFAPSCLYVKKMLRAFQLRGLVLVLPLAPVSKLVSKRGFSLRLRNKRLNGLMLEAFSIYQHPCFLRAFVPSCLRVKKMLQAFQLRGLVLAFLPWCLKGVSVSH
jgi:hypothetical protein